MADKKVSDLIAAEQIYEDDVFVLEQDGTAKKLTGQILMNWLTAAADGHGGISDISKINTSGLKDTYRITLADKTAFDFVVTNGANGEKGDDGAKGDKGDPGRDGISATHSWRGTVLTVTSASGSSSADLKGEKGDDGDDGTSVTIHDIVESSANGGTNVVMFSDGNTLMVKNGISATHSWSGTVLNVTSASGSSSADLKGDKGDPGEKGSDGAAFNLYAGTADFSGFAPLPTSWIDVGESDIYGNKVYGVSLGLEFVLPRVPAKAGDTFTWSASVRSDSLTNGCRIYAYEYDPKNGELLVSSSMHTIDGIGPEETTISRFYTCLHNCMLAIRIAPVVTNASNLLYLSSFKLELGKVDQPRWCKAADDLKGEKGDKGDPGEKGADGTMTFEDLTDEQKESLYGGDGSSFNLYNRSRLFTGEWENLNTSWWFSGEKDSNNNYVIWTDQVTEGVYQPIHAKAGETFTLSALIKGTDIVSHVKCVAREYNADTNDKLCEHVVKHIQAFTYETIGFFTYTCENDCILALQMDTIVPRPMYISSLKLESGTVKNPRWCESLDDIRPTNGINGKDGVSATHSWNGTVLTVTSASGTSSADLKGEKGDPGESGVNILTVTLEDIDGLASHGPMEIYNHVQNGGIVRMVYNTSVYQLAYCEGDGSAAGFFAYNANGDGVDLLEILDDATVSQKTFVDKYYVDRSSTMIVTVNGSTASKTSAEIFNHVKNGGKVYIDCYDTLVALASCRSDGAFFNDVGNDGIGYAYFVDSNGEFEEYEFTMKEWGRV